MYMSFFTIKYTIRLSEDGKTIIKGKVSVYLYNLEKSHINEIRHLKIDLIR